MSTPQPEGYLALPSSSDSNGVSRGPSVLVLHAWWGLNDTIRGVCDALAKAGFRAFAPDLYDGVVTRSIDEAQQLADGLDHGRAKQKVAAAAAFPGAGATAAGGAGGGAGEPSRDPGLAIIGFSLGAFFALDLVESAPAAPRRVVLYYGTRPGEYAEAQTAFLGHYAANDTFEPRSEVEALEASLRRSSRSVTFHTYPGVGHWFAEPDRDDAYDEAAARLAWERTIAFLRGAASGVR